MITRAAAPTMPLNTITAPKVILNKTSRRNTVFLRKRGEKRILIASRRKIWLWKEFDTAWRERSQNQIFQDPLLISTPTHLPTIKLVHK